MVNDIDYEGIEFPVSKTDFKKIENKNNICIEVFCYEKKEFGLFCFCTEWKMWKLYGFIYDNRWK